MAVTLYAFGQPSGTGAKLVLASDGTALGQTDLVDMGTIDSFVARHLSDARLARFYMQDAPRDAQQYLDKSGLRPLLRTIDIPE